MNVCVSELFVLMTTTTVGSSAGSEYSRDKESSSFLFLLIVLYVLPYGSIVFKL